jgi:hypothetical protein
MTSRTAAEMIAGAPPSSVAHRAATLSDGGRTDHRSAEALASSQEKAGHNAAKRAMSTNTPNATMASANPPARGSRRQLSAAMTALTTRAPPLPHRIDKPSRDLLARQHSGIKPIGVKRDPGALKRTDRPYRKDAAFLTISVTISDRIMSAQS